MRVIDEGEIPAAEIVRRCSYPSLYNIFSPLVVYDMMPSRTVYSCAIVWHRNKLKYDQSLRSLNRSPSTPSQNVRAVFLIEMPAMRAFGLLDSFLCAPNAPVKS